MTNSALEHAKYSDLFRPATYEIVAKGSLFLVVYLYPE